MDEMHRAFILPGERGAYNRKFILWGFNTTFCKIFGFNTFLEGIMSFFTVGRAGLVAAGLGFVVWNNLSENAGTQSTLKAVEPTDYAFYGDIGRRYLSVLGEILQKNRKEDPVTPLAFTVLQETQGNLLEYVLPWEERFALKDRDATGMKVIGANKGIEATDLRRSVMWGITSEERLYIVMNYTSDQVKNCVATLFQDEHLSFGLVLRAAVTPSDCPLGSLDPLMSARVTTFSNNFRALLQGKPVYVLKPNDVYPPRLDSDRYYVLKLAQS